MTDNGAYCRSTCEGLAGLAVFSALKEDPLVHAFVELLEIAGRNRGSSALIPAWARFTAVFAGYAGREPFCRVLYRLALTDVNGFTLAAERGDLDQGGFLAALAANDLAALSRAAAFDFGRLVHLYAELFDGSGGAAFERIESEARLLMEAGGRADAGIAPCDWTPAAFAVFIQGNGAGDLSGHKMFCIADGKLHPAGNRDPVRLADLSGYVEERQVVISNTLRFMSARGKEAANMPAANLPQANNILLYGDRGCGKSATVKAVCNEYAERGLRLVELRKAELASLPAVTAMLAGRGLRFILFIDDLSFEAGDGDFMMLKAMLEGGIETTPPNVVIYATSNRRHLVREPRSDRPASSGDVRAFDTMQEQLSLADRFGITVIFSSPSQDEYLRIAEFIARKHGLLPENSGADQLQRFRENAVRWERWFNGRSPRTAVQFVEWLAGGDDFPWDSTAGQL
ncbi:MAG: ATP-binding protein [Spirochaetaceae bacterium]|jgi:predicted AAA+ superfamily ATPase|nr:ATP-binding protein [Spirochaetaceae bacterium]